MGIFGIINTGASGLTAERTRMDVISNNIANVNTTVTENGTPFRRKVVTFQERVTTDFVVPMNVNSDDNRETGNGVRVIGISEDNSPFKYVYDPSHPQANKDGYVEMPNINISGNKLCGIKIIHTHPNGNSMLSALDISALIKYRLDWSFKRKNYSWS